MGTSLAAITSKIGSNAYFTLYNKINEKKIINESTPYAINEEHQIILYQENCDKSISTYVNPEFRDPSDFSIYDISRKRKQFAVKPFEKCKDSHYGSVGLYNSIRIEKLDDHYIHILYNDCKTSIIR